jgi:hypothetical protein
VLDVFAFSKTIPVGFWQEYVITGGTYQYSPFTSGSPSSQKIIHFVSLAPFFW